MAERIVERIDYDFARFDGTRSLLGSVLWTAIFDAWVRQFVLRHSGGTVIEIGTGLNTRFERLDDRVVHWLDLDLPDVIDLRRRFFDDSEQRRMLAASLLDDGWFSTVQRSPGPYFSGPYKLRT